jgi:hypothetical protein
VPPIYNGRQRTASKHGDDSRTGKVHPSAFVFAAVGLQLKRWRTDLSGHRRSKPFMRDPLEVQRFIRPREIAEAFAEE